MDGGKAEIELYIFFFTHIGLQRMIHSYTGSLFARVDFCMIFNLENLFVHTSAVELLASNRVHSKINE